jgi:hypothetical protein
MAIAEKELLQRRYTALEVCRALEEKAIDRLQVINTSLSACVLALEQLANRVGAELVKLS